MYSCKKAILIITVDIQLSIRPGGETTPAILMTAAEVWFLRAEAALRGFSNETPKTCYETGIKTSFAQWGVGVATNYLASR